MARHRDSLPIDENGADADGGGPLDVFPQLVADVHDAFRWVTGQFQGPLVEATVRLRMAARQAGRKDSAGK